MADTSQAELPPQTNGISDGLEDDERNKMRPADIDADVKEMERRKRVESIMNSRLFREELERIIEVQLRDGSGTSGLMQQISDMMGVSKNAGNVFKNSNCVVPINDIRGIEAMGYAKGEKILRCKLAAVYRLIDLYGWTQGSCTMITARLNQDEEHFLVNPYGMLFHEITASSLIKADMQGTVVEQGTTNFSVNLCSYSLHAAIHSARPDIKCIIHVHTPSVVAISALKCGLLPISQESVVIGEVSTHAYIGGLNDPEEKDKIARNLGPNNKVLLLNNQGAVCCGETIEEAFFNARNTVLASESQLKLMPVGIDNLVLLTDEIRKKMYDSAHKAPESTPRPDQPSIMEGKVERKWRVGGVEFEALMRMLDNAGFRTGYIYRHPLVKGEPPRPRNDVEVPPAVSSLGYLLEEEELYKQGLWKKLEGGRKGHDRSRWLNSPNVYQKVEILETGTPDPKKITKWVADGSPTHSSTPVKIDCALQFVPKNTNPKEFKKLQQQIKDYRRADKISAGPQSHILEGVTWEEARKMQDAGVTQTGDQVVLMGAASKGIIQRGYQHNATMYKSPYAKNPFDSITDEDIDEYKKVVEKKVKGEYDTDFSESEGLSSAQINKRISEIRSPTSAASETEEESRDEPQVLRIETKHAPKPSQPEVVLSDVSISNGSIYTPTNPKQYQEKKSWSECMLENFNKWKHDQLDDVFIEESNTNPRAISTRITQPPSARNSNTISMRSRKVLKLAQLLSPRLKTSCYRTNNYSGFPKGSYTVPNPQHFHIVRQTRIAQQMRPALITKLPETNIPKPSVRIDIQTRYTHSLTVDIPMDTLKDFIRPFAHALNMRSFQFSSNQASQTAFVKTDIPHTPLYINTEQQTSKDSNYEENIMKKLRKNLVDDIDSGNHETISSNCSTLANSIEFVSMNSLGLKGNRTHKNLPTNDYETHDFNESSGSINSNELLVPKLNLNFSGQEPIFNSSGSIYEISSSEDSDGIPYSVDLRSDAPSSSDDLIVIGNATLDSVKTIKSYGTFRNDDTHIKGGDLTKTIENGNAEFKKDSSSLDGENQKLLGNNIAAITTKDNLENNETVGSDLSFKTAENSESSITKESTSSLTRENYIHKNVSCGSNEYFGNNNVVSSELSFKTAENSASSIIKTPCSQLLNDKNIDLSSGNVEQLKENTSLQVLVENHIPNSVVHSNTGINNISEIKNDLFEGEKVEENYHEINLAMGDVKNDEPKLHLINIDKIIDKNNLATNFKVEEEYTFNSNNEEVNSEHLSIFDEAKKDISKSENTEKNNFFTKFKLEEEHEEYLFNLHYEELSLEPFSNVDEDKKDIKCCFKIEDIKNCFVPNMHIKQENNEVVSFDVVSGCVNQETGEENQNYEIPDINIKQENMHASDEISGIYIKEEMVSYKPDSGIENDLFQSEIPYDQKTYFPDVLIKEEMVDVLIEEEGIQNSEEWKNTEKIETERVIIKDSCENDNLNDFAKDDNNSPLRNKNANDEIKMNMQSVDQKNKENKKTGETNQEVQEKIPKKKKRSSKKKRNAKKHLLCKMVEDDHLVTEQPTDKNILIIENDNKHLETKNEKNLDLPECKNKDIKINDIKYIDESNTPEKVQANIKSNCLQNIEEKSNSNIEMELRISEKSALEDTVEEDSNFPASMGYDASDEMSISLLSDPENKSLIIPQEEFLEQMTNLLVHYLVKNCLEYERNIFFPELKNDENVIKLCGKLKNIYNEYFLNSFTDSGKSELRIQLAEVVLKKLQLRDEEKLFTISEFLSELLDYFFTQLETPKNDKFDEFKHGIEGNSTPEVNPEEEVSLFQMKRLSSGNEFYWVTINKSPKYSSPKIQKKPFINVDDILLRPPPDLKESLTKERSLSPIFEESRRKLCFEDKDELSASDAETNLLKENLNENESVKELIVEEQKNSNQFIIVLSDDSDEEELEAECVKLRVPKGGSLGVIFEEGEHEIRKYNAENVLETSVNCLDINAEGAEDDITCKLPEGNCLKKNVLNSEDVEKNAEKVLNFVDEDFEFNIDGEYLSFEQPEINRVLVNEFRFFRSSTVNASSYVHSSNVSFTKPKSDIDSQGDKENKDVEGNWMGFDRAKF